MPTFDKQAALDAGYSKDEIANNLANMSGFDVEGARKFYSDDEIIDKLSSSVSAAVKPAGYEKHREAVSDKYDKSVGGLDYIKNSLKKGAGDVAGLVGTIASSLRPGQDAFIPGGYSGLARGQADSALSADRSMKPPDDLTRYAGAVAEFAVPTLVTGPAIVGRAAHKGLAAAGEAVASITGGVGSEAGGDIAEAVGAPRAVGSAIGGVAGGITGPSLTTGASKLLSSKNNVSSAVASKRGQEIKGLVDATDGAYKNIDDSFSVGKDIEEITGIPFTPTLAGRSLSDQVSNLEKEVLGRSAGPAEKAITTQNKNLAAVRSFSDISFPEASSTLKQAARETTYKAQKRIDAAVDDLAAKSKSTADSVEGVLPQQAGEGLDALRLSAKATEKARLDEKIDDIYALAKTKKVTDSMDDVLQSVYSIAGKDKNAYQNMPPVFSKIIDRYADAGDKPLASFEEIHSLYRETNKQLAASVSTGKSDSVYLLGQLKTTLNKKLKNFESEKYGMIGKAFKEWNSEYKEFAKSFYEGVGGRMHANTKYGQLLPKEKIVEKFFTPTGMDDFAKIYKNDPSAVQLLEDGVLSKFHDYTFRDGAIDPALAETFLRRNRAALEKIPSLNKKLSDVKLASEAILEKNKRLLEARAAINDGLLSKVANTDDPIKFIEQAFTDRKTLSTLMNTTEAGRKAVAHSMAHHLPKIAASKGLSVGEFLYANKKTVEPVLNRVGPNHYKNMETIAKAIDILNVGKPPLHPNLSSFGVDPIEALTNTSLASLVSQYRAVKLTRQSSEVHMATSMLGKFWVKMGSEKSRKFQEFLLTDPEAARDFAKAATVKFDKALSNRMSAHLISSGVRVSVDVNSDITEK